MRPLPSTTPTPSGWRLPSKFDPSSGEDEVLDDASLLALRMTRTLAHDQITRAVDAPDERPTKPNLRWGVTAADAPGQRPSGKTMLRTG